tara:strand:+ start:17992 stop:18534 length:543 start_codon:yes stop_codon:yes gene_type:complete
MNIKDLNKLMDKTFGDRHLSIKSNKNANSNFINGKSGYTYADIEVDNMPLKSYIKTKLKVLTIPGEQGIKKHELLRVIFNEWYIIGDDKSITWLSNYYGGIDKCIIDINTFEAEQYGTENLDLRTDTTDPEKVAFRTAIIQGAKILLQCQTYTELGPDDKVTNGLIFDIINEVKSLPGLY